MTQFSPIKWIAIETHKLRTHHALQLLRKRNWRTYSTADKPHIKRRIIKDKTAALIAHDHIMTGRYR